jgi:hypothetical protein
MHAPREASDIGSVDKKIFASGEVLVLRSRAA